MMKPVPAPRRGPCGSRSPGRSNSSGPSGTGRPPNRRRRPLPRDVASMFTTAGLSRSATSANEATAGDTPGVTRARTGICGALGAEIANCGVIEPATTRPMRKAMVAVRQTVTMTNRRVMTPIITLLNQVQKGCFVQHRDTRCTRLLSLAAGLRANNHAGCLFAHGPRDLRAEALERGRGLFARQRLQRAGDDVRLARQPAWRRRCALVLGDLHVDP